MTDFKIVVEDVIKHLNDIHYDNGDLSDIGNEIGIVLGKYIKKGKMGYELESFINGLEHGISITDGTHATCQHINKKEVEEYVEGSYLNRDEYITKIICEDCGIELDKKTKYNNLVE
jgi:hypothetical protein